MPRPPIDHFRFIAPLYEHVFGGDGAEDRSIPALDLPVNGWLLDAGGGTGRVAQTLRDQTGGVVVLDVSTGMLAQTRQKPGIYGACGEVEHLPFNDGQFERILIVDAFHHFFEHEAAARDLWRVLKPGGRLVILEPNIEKFAIKLVALGETLLLMRSRFYTPAAMRQMFAALPGVALTVDTDTDPFYIQLIAEKGAV